MTDKRPLLIGLASGAMIMHVWSLVAVSCVFCCATLGSPVLAKIDHVEGVEKVPAQGPAILMINHINFIDPFVVLNVLTA